MKNQTRPIKFGFTPIPLEDYVVVHLATNPGTNREEVTSALNDALERYKKGAKCVNCGNPIWVIGSAFCGNMCFTCITGEAIPEDEYEIDEACL